MKKLSLNFLNGLEQAVFRSFPKEYRPLSSVVAMSALVAAFASIIVIFFLQMFNASPDWANIVLSIAFGLAFLYSARLTYKAVECLPTTGNKIALGAYVLVLFGACSLLFIWLAVWVMIIALVVLVCWIILKVAFPDSGGGKRATAYHSDGTTEELTEDGKGICGETYYKGDRGGTYVD